MGSGKSQSAISYMNDGDDNYIYLTPYLDEVERIKRYCAQKKFVSPENKGSGKLENLHHLLGERENIASTHALFSSYTQYTADLIHNGNYVLILDEVFSVLDPINLRQADINLMFDSGVACMDEDGEHVKWVDEKYDGTKFADVKMKAETHNLIYYKGLMLFWTFPIEIFEAFKEVIILTYLFDAQIQKYYYDLNKTDIEYLGVCCENGKYHFCEPSAEQQKLNYDLSSLIHVIEDENLNRIGYDKFALSASWYSREEKRKEKPLIKTVQNNLYNLFRWKLNQTGGEKMWTVFKDYRFLVKGKGFASGFVPCNIRATNQYRACNALAYCVNIFFNPVIKQYFYEHGVHVDEDTFALSEMIQWIWRSAIRDKKEIWVYVPSSRMRKLLNDWINEVTKNTNNGGYVNEGENLIAREEP